MKYKYALIGIVAVVALMGANYFLMINGVTAAATDNSPAITGNVKDFYIDSFYTIENGKPHPQYSLKELSVNKGDLVRIHVNVTKGTHDFNIDELSVRKETPTGSVTTVEFVADKIGDFVYYCSMPGHRLNGHWGTLKVQ